jgi:hypothetical protein
MVDIVLQSLYIFFGIQKRIIFNRIHVEYDTYLQQQKKSLSAQLLFGRLELPRTLHTTRLCIVSYRRFEEV